jgi:branched-chain amino acid transport system substrate-binding protein
LRDAIAATKDFNGVTGRTTIDEKRNSSKPAVMLVVKNGKTEFLSRWTPEHVEHEPSAGWCCELGRAQG